MLRGARATALWSGALAAPPLGFFALLLVRRRQERYRRDSGLRRRENALRDGLKGLREVDAAAAGPPSAAAEAASRCLRGYVGDKLGLEGNALTAVEAEAALRRRGVDEALARETHELLDRLEAARYGAPRPADAAGARRRRPVDQRAAGAAAAAARSGAAGVSAVAAMAPLLALALSLPAQAPPPAPSGQEPATQPADVAPAASPAAAPAPPAAPAGPAAGARPEEVFVHANAAYEAGDYPRAVELYQRLRDEGHGDGLLDYDLGNAYLRGGELGKAIAAYLRAEAARPRDQDVRANLTFARKSAEDALAPPAPSPVVETLFFWHYDLGRRELIAAVAVCNLLLWGLLAVRLWRRRSEVLRWAIVAAAVLVAATAGSLAVHLAAPTRVAVVVPQEVDVHSGTRADTVVRFKLHAGTEVRALEQREGWIRIALPDGQQGWLPAQHAELVTL